MGFITSIGFHFEKFYSQKLTHPKNHIRYLKMYLKLKSGSSFAMIMLPDSSRYLRL